MRLVLQQSFPLGRFHATPWRTNPFDDPYGEWPPSPWRLARAVVARWYQWRRETSETWPAEDLDHLIRALCTSDYSFHLPEQARQSIVLRQYQPVEFGWNPKSDKVPGAKSYSTSLVQDNAWCIPPEEDLFWFIESDAWTPDLVEIFDRSLERIVYFGRAEALTRICRVTEEVKAANVTLTEGDSAGNAVPVLVPNPTAVRADIERVTQDPQAARNIPQGARVLYARRPRRPPAREIARRARSRPESHLIQFALGWAVAPELRATVRLTARFRAAVLRNLIRRKSNRATARWSDAPADVRDEIAEMSGKDSQGEPLQGPRRHAEFLLWWDGGVPTRLLVWRGARHFDEDERDSILEAAAQELSWAAAGQEAETWRIKLVPLDTAVAAPPGFDGVPATVWRSLTPYVPARHHLRGGKVRESEMIENQVRRELLARGYLPTTNSLTFEEIEPPRWVAVHVPRREIDKRPFIGDRRGYMIGLAFETPITGPLRLGHSSTFGLGLFCPIPIT